MTRRTRRFPRLAIAAVAVGLMAPTSALGYTDYRSPDAVDGATQVQQSHKAEPSSTSRPVDLRSPDAVDPRFVQTAEPTIVTASSGGFDWGDAGIGAGAILGLLLIGLSVMFTVVHHRNRTAAV